MRSLVCLLPLFALVFGAPVDLNDRQKLIRKIWTNDTDPDHAEIILEEAAAKLGISADEYFDGCWGDLERMALSPEEFAAAERELDEFESMTEAMVILNVNNTDEVLPELRSRLPKTYAGLDKTLVVLKEVLSKMDNDTQQIAQDVGKLALELVVFRSRYHNGHTEGKVKENFERMTKMVAIYKKITAQSAVLSPSSKITLEKRLCLTAYFRIIDSGDGYFEEMVKMMDLTAETVELLKSRSDIADQAVWLKAYNALLELLQ